VANGTWGIEKMVAANPMVLVRRVPGTPGSGRESGREEVIGDAKVISSRSAARTIRIDSLRFFSGTGR